MKILFYIYTMILVKIIIIINLKKTCTPYIILYHYKLNDPKIVIDFKIIIEIRLLYKNKKKTYTHIYLKIIKHCHELERT